MSGTRSGPETFGDDTLRVNEPERDTQRRIVNRVTAVLPEREDYMPVLRALLAPPRAALPAHGASQSLTYKAARKAWLQRCRRWIIAQGRQPVSTQLSADEQRAYAEATGDVWDPAPLANDKTERGTSA